MFAGGGTYLLLQEVRAGVRFAPHRMPQVLSFALRHAARFARVALVGDATWLPTRAYLLRTLLRCEVRRFPADQSADAREWLRTGKRPPHGLRRVIRG